MCPNALMEVINNCTHERCPARKLNGAIQAPCEGIGNNKQLNRDYYSITDGFSERSITVLVMFWSFHSHIITLKLALGQA